MDSVPNAAVAKELVPIPNERRKGHRRFPRLEPNGIFGLPTAQNTGGKSHNREIELTLTFLIHIHGHYGNIEDASQVRSFADGLNDCAKHTGVGEVRAVSFSHGVGEVRLHLSVAGDEANFAGQFSEAVAPLSDYLASARLLTEDRPEGRTRWRARANEKILLEGEY